MSGTPGQDFGWRPGFAQLGVWRVSTGLRWIYAPSGDRDNPAAGTLAAWIVAYGPWTLVTLSNAYEPSAVPDFPTRAAVRAGDTCLFPGIEADALVAAGIAQYA